MLQRIHAPISVLLGASDNGRRAAAGLLLREGGTRLSPATQGMSFLTKGFFFEKLQIKSKQKVPDDRTYSPVSKCAKSFCTHSKKTWVCPVCSYRGWLFFGSCKHFAFSLNVSDAKPAVGHSGAPTTEECELRWAAVICFSADQRGKSLDWNCTLSSPPVAHNSPKPGRKEMVSPMPWAFVQCCQIQMLKGWEMGSSNGNRLRGLWTCLVPCVHVGFTCLGFHGGPKLLFVLNERWIFT